jgi:hypothetical protein
MFALRDTRPKTEVSAIENALPRIIQRFAGNKLAREFLNFAGFALLTSVMTWPWVTRLRDACADPGDPYLLSWLLWWDFHQTFTSPLHLFDANIFYPLHQTLAFSENDYGISLLFFPLFALGFRPLTINSVATFLGFAFCGYGAFRLTRTLTGSSGAAWIAGIVFAFIPFRFHLLSQLHYVFTGWMPLALEALVLFARERSPRRAVWLAVAFTMNGLSCLSWFVLSLAPLALSLVYLSLRYDLLRDRKFWIRGGAAAAGSLVALLPFMLPYMQVSRTFGFSWGPEVIARNSAPVTRWLVAEYRTRLWKGFGDNLPGNGPKLFTGLLSPLLALAAVLLPVRERGYAHERRTSRWTPWLDALAITSVIFAVLSLGWNGSTLHPFLGRFFAGDTFKRSLIVFAGALALRLLFIYPAFLQRMTGANNLISHIRQNARGERWWQREAWMITSAVIWFLIATILIAFATRPTFDSSVVPGNYPGSHALDRALLIVLIAVVIRFSIAYPELLIRVTGAKNLIQHIRDSRGGDVLWLGVIWAVTGFFMSLGTNSWFYRILYDLVFLFRSMREPSRAAMVADLGLAVLAGAGAMKLVALITARRKQLPAAVVCTVIALALLFELRAAPLNLMRGAVAPDQLALRLRQTTMRGGLVELPTGNGILPHLYMLRSADHGKPLINAISTFVPPHAWEIESLSKANPISLRLLDAMERVPTSYLVIHNSLIEPEQRAAFEGFLAQGLAADRLRFINRYDDGNDLYAVVKTEPEAKSEAPLPFSPSIHELSALIREDPVNVLSVPDKFQMLYRMYVATNGTLPRYTDFMRDAGTIAHGVVLEADDRNQTFDRNVREFISKWLSTDPFVNSFGHLTDEQFVDQLLINAGVKVESTERQGLINDLASGRETRAGTLLKIVNEQRFIDKENERSLLLLHYFAYLRRNPDDPPDRDLRGFNFWLHELAQSHDVGRIGVAFQNSIEYHSLKERQQ